MIALIAAIAKNNCIGKNNELPWHIPEDLKHFRNLTKDKTVLMGRKTFESIVSYLGKPLPKRKNLVITTNTGYKAPNGVKIYNSIKSALEKNSEDNIFIIGGAAIYKQTINLADKLYITHVNKKVDGDAFFPKIDTAKWKKTEKENYDGFSFVTYNKIK